MTMESRHGQQNTHSRPDWLTVRAPSGPEYQEVLSLVERLHLHTVCHSAACPNIGECWGCRTATFLILGGVCTRDCGFCAVESGIPKPVDKDEPMRVAEAVTALGLRHAVVTSVTRDDLPDGGAGTFAETIRAIRQAAPKCTVEVLVPDFCGNDRALFAVIEAAPDVLNHNVETVPRLYPAVRPRADYGRSLRLLARVKESNSKSVTKSGLMIGIGEEWDEALRVMADLREARCDILTIGQYLRPTPGHLPVARYYTPDQFETLRRIALESGYIHVESGPLVRSSYHAGEVGLKSRHK